MKKIMSTILLGIFLFGISQEALADEEVSTHNFEINNSAIKAPTVRYYFKSIPPLKYKGRIRIDYYPYDRGYTGVYL